MMDINSFDTFRVVEKMREDGAPFSALSKATGLPEDMLKAYCKENEFYICWMGVYMSILGRENTGRVFSMEALLGKDTMQFCCSKNTAFWRKVERSGCIPQMVEDILRYRTGCHFPISRFFDLRRYGATREQYLQAISEIYEE